MSNDFGITFLPEFGKLSNKENSRSQVRAFLSNLVTKHGLSERTRNRVRSLFSSICNEGINRDEPILENNPTFGLKFKSGKRRGEKPPSFLQTTEECVVYLSGAKSLSPLHYAFGGLGLMGGLRKQEMIALKWGKVDEQNFVIEVSRKFIQASGEIVRGTKRGEESIRYVPMSDELCEALMTLKAGTKWCDDTQFVLSNQDGSHFTPKQVTKLNAEICAEAGVNVTVHGLRHTFGREFASRSNNIHVLKDILGHSNIVVTQRYSELGKDRLKEFRQVVSFGEIDGQKRPDKEV
jgi:integrase